MNKKNKKMIVIVGFIFILTVIISTSLALWKLTFTQNTINTITTNCFKVTFTDDNPVNIQNAVPILDDAGKKLLPYKFTLTNMCDSLATYDINLEILETSTLEDINYLKMLLNESSQLEEAKLLSSNEKIEKTLAEAKSSYKIGTGYLSEKQSKTFELRLWLDATTPTEEKYMNKVLESKVTIVTSFAKAESIENRNMMQERYNTEDKDNYSFMSDSKKIVFRNKKTNKTDIKTIDISYNQDNSVIAYSDTSSDSKITYIEANGNIKFPANSNKLFYNFGSIIEIEGLEIVDTSKVIDMGLMFDMCSILKDLDLSSFDTSNVTNMFGMFYECRNLINLDLGSFNTSKVTDMNIMFYNCQNLKNLNISKFDTSSVTGMNNMFKDCMELIATITIRNVNLSSYANIFTNTAVQDGTQLIVNYTTETEALVDKMLKTKSSSSNVVKGIKVT